MKEEKAGDKCPMCFDILKEYELPCKGKIQRGEPLEKILICLCVHPGDMMCNCGNPCISLF